MFRVFSANGNGLGTDSSAVRICISQPNLCLLTFRDRMMNLSLLRMSGIMMEFRKQQGGEEGTQICVDHLNPATHTS